MNASPEVVERCETERGELQLQRRGTHFEIISNGTFLMATSNGTSERLLVRAALDTAPALRKVLIGGLGVGFSLAEALRDERVEEVSVIEIEPKIVEWNQKYLSRFNDNALADPRTRIIVADLTQWIRESKNRFDAVCLDIDNGPDWTVTEENQWLYKATGLQSLRSLLTPTGVVSIWSASEVPYFARSLEQHFGRVQLLSIPAGRGQPDCIYLAQG